MRGTGIAGLRGMPVKNGNIIRPLLFATRRDIEAYTSLKGISYREDSSNKSLYYERNLVRHQLIPLLESLQENFSGVMAGNFQRLREAEEIVQATVTLQKEIFLHRAGNEVRIEIEPLKNLKPLNTYLYYFLNEFNFNPAMTDKIAESLKSGESKVFYSNTHQLTKDRKLIRIAAILPDKKQDPSETFVLQIPSPTGFSDTIAPCNINSPITFSIREPLPLQFHLENISGNYIIKRQEHIAQLDADTLTHPLSIRHWRPGDSFHPLGIKGKKKLSDFFIDEKFSVTEKKECLLLCSGEDIVWVIGKRIDDRFKIKPSTKRILGISLL
jgi:tRNA(Ile)-lysidine synthase